TCRLRNHEPARRVRRKPSPVAHLAEYLVHRNDALAATRGIDDGIRQPPSQLLSQFQAERSVAFGAIRLAKSRDVEPAGFYCERTSLCAGIPDVPIHSHQVGTECTDGIEDRRRGGSGRKYPCGNPRGGSVRSQRSTCITSCRNGEARNAERLAPRNCTAQPPCLEGGSGIHCFILDPQAANADFIGKVGSVEQRCTALSKRYRQLSRQEWHGRRIAPHVRPLQKVFSSRCLSTIPREHRLPAVIADVNKIGSGKLLLACGALQQPVSHESSGWGGGESGGLAGMAPPGVTMPAAVGDVFAR